MATQDRAIAQSQDAQAAEFLAQAFVGNCIQNAGRNDKVVAAARTFGYVELEGDAKLMVAPQDPNAKFSGWLVKTTNKVPFFLGVSEGLVNGVPYSNCVIANPNISTDSILAEIDNLASIGKVLNTDEYGGQRYRVWEINSAAERSFISAVDAPKMGIVGGSLSFSAPTEK